MKKQCSKCKNSKPATLEYFYMDKSRKDNFTCQCKECMNEYQSNRKEEINKYQKEYRKNNRDKFPGYEKNRSPESIDRKKEYNKEYRKENREKRATYQRIYLQTPNGKYVEYKSRAKRARLTFSLTLDDFMSFWNVECFYCGDAIGTIGLDRLDNSIGYEKDNCVPCCMICNRMKHILRADVFFSQIRKIFLRRIHK